MIDATNKTTKTASKTAVVSVVNGQSNSIQRNNGGSLTNNYVQNNDASSGGMRMSIKQSSSEQAHIETSMQQNQENKLDTST